MLSQRPEIPSAITSPGDQFNQLTAKAGSEFDFMRAGVTGAVDGLVVMSTLGDWEILGYARSGGRPIPSLDPSFRCDLILLSPSNSAVSGMT